MIYIGLLLNFLACYVEIGNFMWEKYKSDQIRSVAQSCLTLSGPMDSCQSVFGPGWLTCCQCDLKACHGGGAWCHSLRQCLSFLSWLLVPVEYLARDQQGVHPASSLSQQFSLSHLYFNNNWWHKSSERSNSNKGKCSRKAALVLESGCLYSRGTSLTSMKLSFLINKMGSHYICYEVQIS